MMTMRKLGILIFMSLFIFACSSNDEDVQEAKCGGFKDQVAQGTVLGYDFTVQGGTYSELRDSYTCRIWVQKPTGGSCFFPTFDPINEELRQVTILFGLDELKKQTITFSDTAEVGVTLNTLNFNANKLIDNTNVTDAELATCGTVEITEVDLDTNVIKGRIVAYGQNGSTINGNFTLDYCSFL